MSRDKGVSKCISKLVSHEKRAVVDFSIRSTRRQTLSGTGISFNFVQQSIMTVTRKRAAHSIQPIHIPQNGTITFSYLIPVSNNVYLLFIGFNVLDSWLFVYSCLRLFLSIKISHNLFCIVCKQSLTCKQTSFDTCKQMKM